MNIGEIIRNKAPGFYVGAAGAVMALVTLFGLYHFLALEINYRMDSLIVYGLGGLDAIFVVATIFYIVSIVATIVASCMRQTKTEAEA